MSSTTTAIPSPTQSGDSNNGGGGGPSSPLLFFVALGFGVVFTNLWIIVGVKYCFRYNQRNRARLAGEDPDAVDLAQMPRQRRRREKKLMTIDEVNERFPLIKYKTWRSVRADQGLSTAGGITNAPTRPASIRNEPRESQDDEITNEKTPGSPVVTLIEKAPAAEQSHTTNDKPGAAVQPVVVEESSDNAADQSTTAHATVTQPQPALLKPETATEVTAVEEEADQIQTAIPAEQLPDPGDTCAICLDNIDDDDDIRGLSCGHAFHASCVDPWLTSRRACCPLCKADYYVPKPRPEGAELVDGQRRSGRSEQASGPPFPLMSTSAVDRRRLRNRTLLIPGVFFSSPQNQRGRNSRSNRRWPTGSDRSTIGPATNAPEISAQNNEQQGWRQRVSNMRLPSLPALSRIRGGRGTESGSQPAVSSTSTPTPAQLEAGRA